MTEIELSERGFPIVLSTSSHTKVLFDKKTDINPKEALVFLGDKRFKIHFVPSDKKILKTCNKHQTEWLCKEFNTKGSIDKVLRKMFPDVGIKKIIKPIIKSKPIEKDTPKTTKETKIETTG